LPGGASHEQTLVFERRHRLRGGYLGVGAVAIRSAGDLAAAAGLERSRLGFNGVSVFAPDGGYEHNRSRLYICASTSLYAVYLGVRGLGV
jgi:hypothetical protein